MTTKPPIIWAYTYRLEPPQPPARLKAVKVLLEREHAAAAARAGTWEARLVTDDRVSHIFVLSDSPDITSEPNRRLEIALQSIDARFSLTVPMIVPLDGDEAVPPGIPRESRTALPSSTISAISIKAAGFLPVMILERSSLETRSSRRAA